MHDGIIVRSFFENAVDHLKSSGWKNGGKGEGRSVPIVRVEGGAILNEKIVEPLAGQPETARVLSIPLSITCLHSKYAAQDERPNAFVILKRFAERVHAALGWADQIVVVDFHDSRIRQKWYVRRIAYGSWQYQLVGQQKA